MPIGAEFYQKQDTRIEGFTKNCNYQHVPSFIDSLWVLSHFLSLSSSDLGLSVINIYELLRKLCTICKQITFFFLRMTRIQKTWN